MEPFVSDQESFDDSFDVLGFFMFAIVTGCVGLFVGGVEGLVCRNPMRALLSGSIGAALGFVGGTILTIPASILYGIGTLLAFKVSPRGDDMMPTGIGLVVLMMGRSAAWARRPLTRL